MNRHIGLGRFGLAAAAVVTVVGGLAAPAHAAGPTATVEDGNNVMYKGTGFADRVTVSADLPGTVDPAELESVLAAYRAKWIARCNLLDQLSRSSAGTAVASLSTRCSTLPSN